MTHQKKRILSLISIVLFSLSNITPLLSQMSKGGTPIFFTEEMQEFSKNKARSLSNNTVQIEDLDSIAIEQKLEEVYGDCKDCKRKYYGEEVDLNVNFFEKATSFQTDSGTIWLLNIQSEKAKGYQFLFNKFWLPENSRLFIFNEERTMALGAFTTFNNSEDSTFYTQHINGKNVCIEYFEPINATQKAHIEIDKAVYIFSDCFSRKGTYSKVGADTCHINTACVQGLGKEIEIKSTVALLTKSLSDYKFWGICSGVLINKSSGYKDTDKPYLLSASHCYKADPSSFNNPNGIVILFRYETLFCSEYPDENFNMSSTNSVTGANVIARDTFDFYRGSDYLLLQFKETVETLKKFDIAYAGWNTSETGATGYDNFVGVHHPEGDFKKISISNNPVIEVAYDETPRMPRNYWAVRWTEGITSPGSSGSPLFNSNHEVIGILAGGHTYCANKYEGGELIGKRDTLDYYGKFCLSHKKLSNYIGSFNAMTYEPTGSTSDNSLNVRIMTDPETPNDVNEFTLKAVATNGVGNMQWHWKVNKYDGDITEYNDGDTRYMDEKYYSTTNQTSEIKLKRQVGYYKVKLYASDSDGNNRYTTVDMTINVQELADRCFDSKVTINNITNERLDDWDGYDIALGSTIQFNEITRYPVNFDDFVDRTDPECYPFQTRHPNDPGKFVYSPKYDGVREIQWMINNQNNPKERITFNATDRFSSDLFYNIYSGTARCVNFDSIGIQTVTLLVKGGWYSYTETGVGLLPLSNINPKHIKDDRNVHERVDKKFRVINCSGSGNDIRTDQDYLDFCTTGSKGDTCANLRFHMGIEAGKKAQFAAYNSITLKNGFQAKEGSEFSIKAKKCPPLIKCSPCETKAYLPNSRIQESEDTNQPTNIETNSLIEQFLIYPNPTSGILKAISVEEKTIEWIQISGINGENYMYISGNGENSKTIDISHLSPGMYIVKVLVDGKFIMEKILLQP